VSKIEPAIWLPGKVLDNHFLGAWEAEVTVYQGNNRWNGERTVPVRFLIAQSESHDSFMNGIARGAEGQLLLGVIDNWDGGAMDSRGRCIKGLETMGATNPFFGATTPAFSMYRHPNMHGIHDQVIVLDYPSGFDGGYNGMGNMNAFTPSALIQKNPDEQFLGPAHIYGHGTPNGHDIRNLHKVSSDATSESCNP
jgi:hypothetical protein